jgi:hypothetical protein
LVYFTKDRKVIRVDQISQGTRIILFQSPLEKMAPRKSSYTIVDFFRRIPLYIVFLIFGVIFVSPFVGRYYKRLEFYLALLLGGATFAAVKQLIFPLQKWYGSEILIPAVESGGSLYYYAIYTALISGLLYETIKLLPIALVYFWKKPNRRYAIALGVICGLGFGIYGAGSFAGSAYQTGILKIVSWPVFEQIVFILFSATAGAAFGFGFSRGARNLLPLWIIMVVIRALSDYLVVFLQKSIFDMPILQLVRALVCVLTIAALYIVVKKAEK